MKCDRCGQEITEGNSYTYRGEVLCEECYLDLRLDVKACDPWAVRSAVRFREDSGLQGTEGLTEVQKQIYELVKRRGKVTREEVRETFDLPEPEMQKELATLRHCELIKGYKEGDMVYLILYG